MAALNECDIRNIALIRGYRKEAITLPNIRYYDNDTYEETGELYSLFCAENEMAGRGLIIYGDIVFDTVILEKLLKSPADISLVVDLSWSDSQRAGEPHRQLKPDLVSLDPQPGPSTTSRFVVPESPSRITRIGQELPHEAAHGEFIGMAMLSELGTNLLKRSYHESAKQYANAHFHEASAFGRASFTDLVQELIDQGHAVHCVPVYKGWMEVDSFEEYQRAWANLRT